MRFRLKTMFIVITLIAFFLVGLRHSIDRTPGPPQGIAHWMSKADTERRTAKNGSVEHGIIDRIVMIIFPNWGKRPEDEQ